MWWEEEVLAVARARGWPTGRGDLWYVVDGGPRFGLFGPRRLAVEVRNAGTGVVLGSLLLDPARRSVVATRVGPRRLVPVWKLRRWASWLLWTPVSLSAWVSLSLIGAGLRASEWLVCVLLRRVGERERRRFLADLPPEVRERVARRCGVARPAEPGAAPDAGRGHAVRE